MSTAEEEVRLSMRVMINKEKTKVLFAIVDNKLADILLSFLTLPMGMIPQLLGKHFGEDEAPNIGSLNTLYKGLENLDSSHFRTEVNKLMLLNPRSSLDADCSKLQLNIYYDTQPIKYFSCEDMDCRSAIMYHDTERCPCGKSMNRNLIFPIEGDYEDGEVFTVKTSTFLISDDLRMLPNVTGSFLQTIKDLGITDTNEAQQMTFTIGFNQIMELLKWSLLSQFPLTDLILGKSQIRKSSSIANPELFILPPEMNEEANSSSKKFKVKATVQKSTYKLLFVQAEEDFIDFLFSFLTIPLAQVERLLGSNTWLGSIDNMYKSLSNLNADKYLKTPDAKGWLLDPKIPPNFLSKNQIFPISEKEYTFKGGACNGKPPAFVNPNNEGSYLKGPGMFMVTDDLTVTPLCMLSTISTLNELKIPLCDVEELEIDIGLEEGLRILKASLTLTYALTNGLIHILRKQLKQEN
ncbi:hypothetical protein ACJIZ3_019241 [Penstemon smallii]|uniref:DUF674 family protein n=1 Tax=Penstemon smallii TaxID=265156 RepID=A0ABD3T0L3_9LAMI